MCQTASAEGAEAAGSDAAAPVGSEVVLDPELLGETEATASDKKKRPPFRAEAARFSSWEVHASATAPNPFSGGPERPTEPEPEVHLTLSESDTFVRPRPRRYRPARRSYRRPGAAERGETGALLARKVGSEAYVDASAQTVNLIRKEKLAQSAVVTRVEQASQSSVWEMARLG